MKVDIHVFSAVEKNFFDMLSLENSISDIVPNVSNKQKNLGVNPYSGYDFVWNYMKHHNKIKIAVFPPGILCALIDGSEGVKTLTLSSLVMTFIDCWSE